MLTKKQRDLLSYLVTYARENEGMSPSYREMSAALGFKGKSQIYALIARLEVRGFVRKSPHRARGIEVLREPTHEFQAGDPKHKVLWHLGKAREILGTMPWKQDVGAIVAAQGIETAIVLMQDAFKDIAA